MTWEIWKGFIIGNIWIIFWLFAAFFVWCLVRKFVFDDVKPYLKNIGAKVVGIVPYLWTIVRAIFNWTKIQEKN